MLYFRNMEVETVTSKGFYKPPKILFKACMLKTKETKNIIEKRYTICIKKVREKSRESHNHKPQPFPDTKRKRKPTNPNRTNVRKALKLALSSPSEVIAMLKGLKNTRTK